MSSQNPNPDESLVEAEEDKVFAGCSDTMSYEERRIFLKKRVYSSQRLSTFEQPMHESQQEIPIAAPVLPR